MSRYYQLTREIVHFIRKETNGLDVIIGLSGGLDSAVVTALANRAMGSPENDRVKTMLLPYGSQNPNDGKRIADIFGLGYEIVNIKPMVDVFESALGLKLDSGNQQHRLVRGNLMARVRMCCLYAKANMENRLVLGTTNKSEHEIGYSTKYGDSAADLEPIQDLYKTEVRELAKHLGLPSFVIEKKPSAELWEGQTDEAEIGIPYHVLDKILKGEHQDIDPSAIEYVGKKVLGASHKKNPPKYPRLRHFLAG